MQFEATALCSLVEGSFLQTCDEFDLIERVLLDSRQLLSPARTLFIALPGLRQDGHNFIDELFQRGVRNFIVSDLTRSYPSANVIVVPDTLRALQKMAQSWRHRFDIPIVGITGSNGKTMIKEWLAHLLDEGQVVRSPRSFNSQVGVPLSVLNLRQHHEVAIIEAGISQRAEMEKLAEIIQPTIGVFTNIGSAHDAGFSNLEEKIFEKSLLFTYCEKTICCYDHHNIVSTLRQAARPLFTWSDVTADADLHVLDKQVIEENTRIDFTFHERKFSCSIPFSDEASVENAIHCLAVLAVLDQLDERTLARMSSLPVVRMRLEVVQGVRNCTIINDCYNADLESLQVAMSMARRYTEVSKTLIVSEFPEISAEQVAFQIANLADHCDFSRIISVGKRLPLQSHDNLEVLQYTSTQALIADLSKISFKDELILVKGARHFHFEQLTTNLRLQSQEAVLEVDLSALARNIKTFESYLSKDTALMVMVKAAAYGSGATDIARFLESRQSVDYLGVAYIDEGVELRQGGVKLPILVLNPEKSHWDRLFEYQLEPEVYSLSMLRELMQQADLFQQQLGIHLNIDTGMARLGFDPIEIEQAGQLLSTSSNLEVRSIFTHLSASDDQQHDDFSHHQIATFDQAIESLAKYALAPCRRHVLNSNGIVRFPQYQYEMVRLGIGLYGVGVAETELEPVHSLITSVSQIREVPAGSSVGYGRSEIAKRDLRIATIGIGYADGLIRKAGNRRYSVLVEGMQAPIVGNICMDMTMIDVTDNDRAVVGSQVELFGKRKPIAELCQAAETIPYEVFTGISPRVRRTYFQE